MCIYKTNCEKSHISKSQLKKKCILWWPVAKTCNLPTFVKIITYLCNQFKQKSHISKNQPWKMCEFYRFSEKTTYIYKTNHEKRREFCRFSVKQTYIYTTNHKKGANFADFRRIKCIVTQPIFGDMIAQPIAKKSHAFQKISV